MRQFFQRNHCTIWAIIVLLAVVVASFWIYGLHEGTLGTGVNWRHT